MPDVARHGSHSAASSWDHHCVWQNPRWSPCLSFPRWRGSVCGSPPPGMCRAFHPFTVSVSRELPSEGQQVQTQLHRSCSEDFYTYHNVPWKIYIRKEVRWGGRGTTWGQTGVKVLRG